jgi:hypothetical protein
MGPASSVLIESDDEATLDAIDELLTAKSDQISRTRKGRVWDVWIRERPIHVQVVNSPPAVELSAGCNSTVDRNLLQELTECISNAVGIGR